MGISTWVKLWVHQSVRQNIPRPFARRYMKLFWQTGDLNNPLHITPNVWLGMGMAPSIQRKCKVTYANRLLRKQTRGAWVAQSVECPTSAQVMISRFMSLSPTLGPVLTAQSLEPASDSVSPCLSLSLCLSLTHALSLSPSKINK